MSGLGVSTVAVVAFANVLPTVSDFSQLSVGDFTAVPVRTDEVQLTGAIVDFVTNVAVGVIDLYYPVRDAGQSVIDLANAIVYNPFIWVWPITAWMSQVNAAWYLGTGILDDT